MGGVRWGVEWGYSIVRVRVALWMSVPERAVETEFIAFPLCFDTS